ncbi:nickel-responsive transcriptional regulator NikR [Roseomonas stagni]|uniref:Putative nickel-responsive regulator n=1 Tax=Falsiroseomonas algicola TaxID=2716930 RepID=A0A6M1LLX6_9PROT|nr:nickel-responsive transcriptional regulator NikR [Falsiroseomonas algicola]NGM21213.1 nickel-responsive transcriptional regulator NikR [Falsiroseomonas algicola]
MTQRITITLDDDTVAALDAFMAQRGSANRSEAMRDLLHGGLARHAEEAGEPQGDCVAVASFVYDHAERELGRRLLDAQHAHHDLSVATLHAHLDAHHCVEVALLRGPAQAVRPFAESLIAERGVRLGRINLMPAPRAGRRRGGHHHE